MKTPLNPATQEPPEQLGGQPAAATFKWRCWDVPERIVATEELRNELGGSLAREIGAANVGRLLEPNSPVLSAPDKPQAVTALPSQEEQAQRMRELIRQQMRRQMQ